MLTLSVDSSPNESLAPSRADLSAAAESWSSAASMQTHDTGTMQWTTSAKEKPEPGQSNILVAVRVRTLLANEKSSGARNIMKCLNENMVIIMDPGLTAQDDYLRLNKSKERKYAFDHVFDESASQQYVYDKTCKFLISGVLQGFNATVFAYGATGAGKTYTMMGGAGSSGTDNQFGIMSLALSDLFSQVSFESRNFHVRCSFLEVYNETLRDLLSPSAAFLDLREDPEKGMSVCGITEVGGVRSAQEIIDLLRRGNKNRTTEPTAANVTSSRSHAVLQVTVEHGNQNETLVGKLSLIDLAGSERASQTANKGLRLLEGANINRSLLALGNCITALADAGGKPVFVPYRDSKLTRLLKDSLGGNCRTVMIANASPNHLNYEDTHNTLKYANRAKNIKTKAVRNVLSVPHHIAKYNEIIDELKGVVTDLKSKLASQKTDIVVKQLGPHQDDSEVWKKELSDTVQERVELRRSLIDLDDSNESEDQRIVLKDRIASNDARLNKLQLELPNRVRDEGVRAFLQLLFRNQVLEVEAMEISEQSRRAAVAHAESIRLKDAEIKIKDSEISRLRSMLARDTLDENVDKILEEGMGKTKNSLKWMPSPERLREVRLAKALEGGRGNKVSTENFSGENSAPKLADLFAKLQLAAKRAVSCAPPRSSQTRTRSEKAENFPKHRTRNLRRVEEIN